MTDLDTLTRIAQAASAGPWRICGASEGACSCRLVWFANGEDGFALGTGLPDGQVDAKDWHYVAAASPDVMLGLIARIRALEAGDEAIQAEHFAETRARYGLETAVAVVGAKLNDAHERIRQLEAALVEACDGWDVDRDMESRNKAVRSVELRKLVKP